MSNKYLYGSPLLMGDNTSPGLQIPEELKKHIPTVFKAVRDLGCDFYPTVIQKVTYDEMSEIAAYGGFGVRYPHWRHGMEYEELQKGYVYGMQRIYELVVNTNPCYLYCMDSNTLVDDITVIAHALGHNHFFKNNIYFSQTNTNMINQLANNGSRIRRYMSRWGKEPVMEFIDHVLRIDTLIDPAKAWEKKTIKNPIIQDSRKYEFPKRIKVEEGHDYMDAFINPKDWINQQKDKIKEREIAEQLSIFTESTKDVMKFLRDNAPLKPWQSDILAMLYEEALYFAPQRQTKVGNEGFASWVDYKVMCEMGLAGLGQKNESGGIIEYSIHKMGVLGGKYSTNPYKLGYTLLTDIENRWNKGRFGTEYENCDNMVERQNWDKKLGLGKEKVFEISKTHCDLTLILEYFTPEFCVEHDYFEWEKLPNGDKVISGHNFENIKGKLVQRHLNGGLPEIKLVDINHRNSGALFLEHTWDGRELYMNYAKPTLASIYALWKRDVYLSTKNKNGEEVIYWCFGDDEGDVGLFTRDEYEAERT